MDRILSLHFRPPLAIARVGGSATPLESFIWESDRGLHGAHRTVIRPRVTFSVSPDGTPVSYLPTHIQFRDGQLLRPVAPFFELWACVQSAEGEAREVPLSLEVLERVGASTNNVEYNITVANRKAQRRTGSAACAFIACVVVSGSDHERKPLLAYSPHNSDQQPLVFPDRPIPLGHFQVIRPIAVKELDADLSVLRVRFTPATGQVYGPPTAIVGVSSPLEPGATLARVTLGGRMFEIVPPENRLLNPYTPWSTHVMNGKGQADPQPCDTYDGVNVGDDRSWAIVDDTCDGIIEAQLVVHGQRFLATSRVLSSNPDYSPDRRPFFSLADDLADRDPLSTDRSYAKGDEAEIADLFERVLETASSVNLDATRAHAIITNGAAMNVHNTPLVDEGSMTAKDRPYVDLIPTLLPSGSDASLPHDRLRYSDVIDMAHGKLADFDTLIDFLRTRPDHIKGLIRPPYGRFFQLPSKTNTPDVAFRDPRVVRDTLHDMRMPPYMRDSDGNSLSLTWRQYKTLMDLVDSLARVGAEPPAGHRATEAKGAAQNGSEKPSENA